jgi:hypothetical protein
LTITCRLLTETFDVDGCEPILTIMALTFFWPVGLAALINAAKVDRAVFTGDLAAAERMSAAARKLSFWAFGVFGALVVLYLGFIAIMIATTVSNLKPLQ